jgi:hypothetical protein
MDDLDRVFHRLVSNIRHRHPEYLTLPFTVQELYETLIPYRHHRRELGIETNQDYEIAVTRLLSGERDYLQADPEMRDKLQAELASSHFDTGAFREFAGAKVSLAPEALRRIRALTVPARDGAAESAVGAAPTSTTATGAAVASGAESPSALPGAPGQSAGFSVDARAAGASAANVPPGAIASGAAVSGTPSPGGFSATFPLSPAPGDSSQSAQAPAAIPSLLNVSVPEGCPFCSATLPEGRTVIYCPSCGHNLSISRCPACGSELEKGWKFCITCGRSVA